jgi:DNA-binding transcriptional LysR family regulator
VRVDRVGIPLLARLRDGYPQISLTQLRSDRHAQPPTANLLVRDPSDCTVVHGPPKPPPDERQMGFSGCTVCAWA